MPDLDDRLGALSRQVAPSRPPLEVVELRRRGARHRRQRAVLVGAPLVVLALLVGAFVVGRRGSDATTSLDTVDRAPAPSDTGPDAGAPAGGSGVPGSASTFDQGVVVAWIGAGIDLREALSAELLDVAAWSATPDAVVDLSAHRAATDDALGRYRTATTNLASTAPPAAVVDAMAQVDARLQALPTMRIAVDARQNDGRELQEQYLSTLADLAGAERAYLRAVDSPGLFWPLRSHDAAAVLTNADVATSARILHAATVGYYPGSFAAGSDGPSRTGTGGRAGCGDDAAAAGRECAAYAELVRGMEDADRAGAAYLDWASTPEKETMRAAVTADGRAWDDLVVAAVEGGIGGNDLTGSRPGSRRVDPVAFRAAADRHLAALFAVERELVAPLR